MTKVIEMDEKVSLGKQLQQEAGDVVLIITFIVEPEDEDKFVKTWASAAEISKKTQESYQHNSIKELPVVGCGYQRMFLRVQRLSDNNIQTLTFQKSYRSIQTGL
jgi:hypothetical protein